MLKIAKLATKKTFSKNIKNDFKESISLKKMITSVIKKPGFKIDREAFLRTEFKDYPQEIIEDIIAKGPVEAGFAREEIREKATEILNKRISSSTPNSSTDNISEKNSEQANLSADILQFYSIALGAAQEISYLYGESDLWKRGSIDSKEVKNQLMLYCLVMLGATGAAKTVRVFASSLAKEVKKKMLTKIFYFPLIKAASKALGKDVSTKSISQGISQTIPVMGEIVSDGITLATLLPMGNRLIDALDKAHFDYSEEDYEKDIKEIIEENQDL